MVTASGPGSVAVPRAGLAAQARAALALVDLCQQHGWELDQAGTSGVYVLTRRHGTAVHVVAGSPAEILDVLRTE
ncbi:MAG TPA: hypothetical protein VFV41_00845 [Streptosporangiaceae bacterium]|nr:hypothetical protein [Streptosporangiaceae bacterium]